MSVKSVNQGCGKRRGRKVFTSEAWFRVLTFNQMNYFILRLIIKMDDTSPLLP